VERLPGAAESTDTAPQPKTDGINSHQIAYANRPFIAGRKLDDLASDFVTFGD